MSDKGLRNNYLKGGGVGKPEGGHKGKSQLERGGLDVKFNTYRGGALLFALLFTNWKSVGRAIRVQTFILAYTGIKLGKYQLQVL